MEENQSNPIEYTFGLLGEKLSHSYSPQIHEKLGSSPYKLIEIDRENVQAFIEKHPFRGINVTIPYKRIAAETAQVLSYDAERLGNANTLIVQNDGTLYADNTDYYGFKCMVNQSGIDIHGKTCLILGDGAAAQTVKTVLMDLGAGLMVAASRHGKITFDHFDKNSEVAQSLKHEVAVIVNATPVGMYPHANDSLLIDLGEFTNLELVLDLIYNPLRTRIIQEASRLGIPAYGGLYMLVAQAKRASDLFLSVTRSDSIIDIIYSELLHELETVSIIGMPGSGKTTVGKRLAKLLNKTFVDVDVLIEQKTGLTIPQIFESQGEEGFRKLEEQYTYEACSGPCRVVSCGGGVVTREANYANLHMNGRIVLLERGLGERPHTLSSKGRPVSQKLGIEKIRETREPLYRAWADLTIDSGKGSRDNAKKLTSILQEGDVL
ncbi:MAG: hypothetical protein IKE43_13490 [Coriobacteriales bacterium]|nr:hypothetical protein [Coriobacteriales bacterium]